MEEDKTYRIVNEGGDIAFTSERWRKRKMSFKTKDELLFFLHDKFHFPYYGYQKGVDNLRKRNKILSKCCHNWNEFYYITETKIVDKFPFRIFKTIKNQYKYMILDTHDRIMNIADLVEKSFHFCKDVDID